MSVPEATLSQMSGAVLAPDVAERPQPDGQAPDTTPPSAEAPEEPKRRRRLAIFLLLAALLGIFLLFAAWYLITRKPVTEIIPPIATTAMPAYSFSIYGTTSPLGIAVTPAGDRLYVVESDGARMIRIFDGKGTQLGAFARPKTTPADRKPMYVAIEPSTGDVYVSDRIARTITVFDKDGLFRREFVPKPAMPDWQPLGLTFGPDGNLWVGDVSDPIQRIHEFKPDGTWIQSVGVKDEFSFPNGVAIAANGNLLIADGNHGRLAQVTPGGQRLPGITSGLGDGRLGLPRGLAIDDSGRIYVSDTSGAVVDIYKLDERSQPDFIGSFAEYGRGDGQLRYPGGVATDTRGRVYVADWANDRVEVWSY